MHQPVRAFAFEKAGHHELEIILVVELCKTVKILETVDVSLHLPESCEVCRASRVVYLTVIVHGPYVEIQRYLLLAFVLKDDVSAPSSAVTERIHYILVYYYPLLEQVVPCRAARLISCKLFKRPVAVYAFVSVIEYEVSLRASRKELEDHLQPHLDSLSGFYLTEELLIAVAHLKYVPVYAAAHKIKPVGKRAYLVRPFKEFLGYLHPESGLAVVLYFL